MSIWIKMLENQKNAITKTEKTNEVLQPELLILK